MPQVTPARPLSIVQRLTRLNMLVLALTLLFTVLLLAAATWYAARERQLQVVAVNAEQLALNLASSLVFADKAAANAELSTYASRPGVLTVAVYDKAQQLFSSAPHQPERRWQQTNSYQQLAGLQLQVSRPVYLKNEIVGTVVVTESLAAVQQALLHLLALFAGIVLLALLLASRLLRSVQQKALAPVVELAELADHAARSQDYSVRGIVRQRDEVGRLTERLNELFKRIEIWQQDLTNQLQHQIETSQQLDKLAHTDRLTGLANRLYFENEFPRSVANARQQHQRMALLFIDLDNFKTVNDQWGHDAGDTVLQIVSKRMSAELRAVDLLFRLGGDEFAVLIQPLAQTELAGVLAQRLISAIREPMYVKDQLMPVGATVGLAFFPDDSPDAGSLLQHADQAMYQAKRAGKNSWRRYTHEN